MKMDFGRTAPGYVSKWVFYQMIRMLNDLGKPGRRHAPFPQGIQLHRLPGGGGYFEDDFPSGMDQFGGEIDDRSAHPRGIGAWNHRSGVFLETFEQEERDRHEIIVAAFGANCERKFLMTEVFESRCTSSSHPRPWASAMTFRGHLFTAPATVNCWSIASPIPRLVYRMVSGRANSKSSCAPSCRGRQKIARRGFVQLPRRSRNST